MDWHGRSTAQPSYGRALTPDTAPNRKKPGDPRVIATEARGKRSHACILTRTKWPSILSMVSELR